MLELLTFYGVLSSQGLIIAFLSLFVLHWVADFVLQNDEMAQQKSTSNKALTKHVALYSIPFLLVYGPLFATITFACHWLTDYFSSRAAKKAFLEGRRHDFFVIIGLDQLLHTLQLVITFALSLMVISLVHL